MKHVLATCLGRVITTEIGGMDGHNLDEVRFLNSVIITCNIAFSTTPLHKIEYYPAI